MHSGVASCLNPWPGKPRNPGTGPAKPSLKCFQTAIISSHYVVHVTHTLLSSYLRVPSFFLVWTLLFWLFSDFSRDLSCFVSALGQFGKGHSVFLSLAQPTIWLLPKSLHETKRPHRDRFSLRSTTGLCKRTVSTKEVTFSKCEDQVTKMPFSNVPIRGVNDAVSSRSRMINKTAFTVWITSRNKQIFKLN